MADPATGQVRCGKAVRALAARAAAGVLCLAMAGCGRDLPSAAGAGTPATSADAVVTQAAEAAIGEYAGRLRSALTAALAEGGPETAVEVCNSQATAIAGETGARHRAVIRRTTLKPRNPANAPDQWERAQLLAFSSALGEGAEPRTLSAVERVKGGYRYMTPIITQPLCLTCHGEGLAPDLAQVLDRYYPQDQARGYQVGELRGAFSLRLPAPGKPDLPAGG